MGCTHSKDALESVMRPSQDASLLHVRQGRSLSQLLRSGSKQGPRRPQHTLASASSHRDVFSIFGEHGMVLEGSNDSPSFVDNVCSPFSASGSVFSTATTASDTERTHIHGPVDQYIPALSISYGAYSDKGMRKQNEDRKVCTSQRIHDDTVAYFGIYDGHGGAKVADYLAKNLHSAVFESLRRTGDMKSSIEDAFSRTDDLIFHKQMESGSTAVSVMVRGRDAIIASVGDSQAVLSTDGKARAVSVIHSPDSPGERERIFAAKGVVVKGRIFGLLAVSRSFGDNDFKTSRGEYKQKFKGDLVTAVPDVMQLSLTDEDEFMVLGCDGLFEVMDPQQVVDFVRAKLHLHGEVQHACEELVSYAISIGSTDNVSAVIVCFNQIAPEDSSASDE